MKCRCFDCGKKFEESEVKINIYGEYLCPKCHQKYIKSPKAELEFFISFITLAAQGKMKLSDCSSKSIENGILAWRYHSRQNSLFVLDLSDSEREKIIEDAKKIGIWLG
jgi:hypothetical protein